MIGRVSSKRLVCVAALAVQGLVGGAIMPAVALTAGVAVLLAILVVAESEVRLARSGTPRPNG
jgi:hypothetical protein